MGLLLTEILICLLVAFLLGLLVGWWMWGRNPKTETIVKEDTAKINQLNADYTAKLLAKDQDLHALRVKIGDLEAKLNACHENVSRLESEKTALSASALTSVMPAFNPTVGIVNLEEQEDDALPMTPPALPAWMPTASADQRDDLKEVKGIGPFLEQKLNAFGIYTFKQVAFLTKENIKELGGTFGSFPDRIEREKWAEQARELHLKYHGEDLDDKPRFTN